MIHHVKDVACLSHNPRLLGSFGSVSKTGTSSTARDPRMCHALDAALLPPPSSHLSKSRGWPQPGYRFTSTACCSRARLEGSTIISCETLQALHRLLAMPWHSLLRRITPGLAISRLLLEDAVTARCHTCPFDVSNQKLPKGRSSVATNPGLEAGHCE